MIDTLIYALWCWGSYGLMMGSFVYDRAGTNYPIANIHLFTSLLFSLFGIYSFIFAVIRSMLRYGFTFPLSWKMNTGIIK